MYYFFLYDNAGVKYNVPFESLSINEELNAGMTGSLSVNYFALKKYSDIFTLTPDDIIATAFRYFELYRESSLIFSGVLVNRQISGKGSQATKYNFTFCDWFNALERRITGNDSDWWYSDDDSADIAWDLIVQTQAKTNGNLGITRGLHPSTIHRDRTYRFDKIRDSLVKMSNKELYNGYDCEITPEKIFNIYYPKGSVKADLVLDDANIISWSSSRNLSGNLANSITVLGAGQEDSILNELRENATAQASWNLQEQTLSAKDVTTASILQDKGDLELLKNALPKDVISLSINDTKPDVESYNLGDTLPVKIKIINFEENLRILKRGWQIKASGQAQINLTFDYE
jgi:hypothetical protein